MPPRDDGPSEGGSAVPSFRLQARLRVRTVPVVHAVQDQDFYNTVSNYAMITMGGRLTHYEAVIPDDGILNINHTFEPIGGDVSYHNQMGWRGEPSDRMREQGILYDDPDDTRIKSHCIVWLFRRRYEGKAGSAIARAASGGPAAGGEPAPDFATFKRADAEDLEQPGAVDAEDLAWMSMQDRDKPTPLTPVLRCHLIGSEAIDVGAVCRATIALTEDAHKEGGGGVREPKKYAITDAPDVGFSCCHNFCDTSSTIEILPLTKADGVEALQEAVDKLAKGVKAYVAEEAKAVEEGRDPDHGAHAYMPSMLADLCRCNEIVKLQQNMMQVAALRKLQEGKLELADEMGAAFLSGATYLQMHGLAACFTDMSDIVRTRAVEIPFRLLMIHARTAMHVNGLTPKEVCGMHMDADREKLFAVYLSILTCEMMDQRQAGYYSDFCLYGVEECSDDDYANARQPGDTDLGADGETWFYRKYYKSGEFVCNVRYRLRLTEDQRQVCTGKGLRYGMINDDCESSASFAMAEHKTAMCLKSDMLARRIIDDGDVPAGGDAHASRHEAFGALLESMIEGGAGGSAEMEAVRSATGGDSPDDVYTFMAVANVLRQFDLRLDLCIGTAGAAAVGAAAHLSGHCYAMCRARHHHSGEPLRMIVEGTRWVTQEACKKKEDRLLDTDGANKLNEIASILMEMTKLPEMDILMDAGVGLIEVVHTKTNFYRSVYVCGDSIQLRRAPSGMITVGAPVTAVLGAEPGEPVDSLPVRYNLVCREIERRVGKRIRPSAVGGALRKMARETIVPPWSKKHWKDIMDNFNAFEVLACNEAPVAQGERRPQPNPEGHPKCIERGPERVRFVFSHQLYAKMHGERKQRFKEVITQCINGVREGEGPRLSKVPVTEQHRNRLLGKLPEGTTDEDRAALAKQVLGFDEQRAMQRLAGFPGMVHIERIFVSMNSVVTVCTIHPDDVPTVHSMVTGWIKEIVDAQQVVLRKMQEAQQVMTVVAEG